MIEQVIMEDGNYYRFVSLKDREQTINLSFGRDYFILKVVGTSMNRDGNINDGDYVLMQAKNNAESGDIVAAEIVDIDECATLKRYIIDENGKISLQPESDDPKFQDPISVRREFANSDYDFHIRGVALAVFKRIEADN